MASRVGRNDLCPCGSGKKYKQCCEKSGVLPRSRKLNQILAGLFFTALLVAAASAYVSIGDDDAAELEAGKTTAPPITLTAPARTNLTGSAATAPQKRTPAEERLPEGFTIGRPPGPAPEGKVWYEEHKHWHAIDDNTNNALSSPSPEPTFPAPREGMTWNPDHGHWHGPPGEKQIQQAGREFEERYGRKFGAGQEPKRQLKDQSLQRLPAPKAPKPQSPRDSS